MSSIAAEMSANPITRKRRILWSIIIALALFDAAVIIPGINPLTPITGIALYISGRAAGCSLLSAMRPINATLSAKSEEIYQHCKAIMEADNLWLVRTPRGNFWTPPGTPVSFLLAEQELDVYRAKNPLMGIHSGDVVLDCGANIGTFVRKALDAGASRVIAIEILPLNALAIRKTFANEIADGRVDVVSQGVWHEDSTMQLSVFDNSSLDSLVMRERNEEKGTPKLIDVQVTTIDAIVSRLGLRRVDFIKMDIEGAERNALRGAADTLRRFRPRLSIAAENLPDDFRIIPKVISEFRSDYRVDSGPCIQLEALLLRPEVLNFY